MPVICDWATESLSILSSAAKLFTGLGSKLLRCLVTIRWKFSIFHYAILAIQEAFLLVQEALPDNMARTIMLGI